MKQREFNVGDRVRVYGNSERGHLCCPFPVNSGEALKILANGWIEVSIDNDKFSYNVHSKQCRRIKPKEKKVPREWKVSVGDRGEISSFATVAQMLFKEPIVETIRVREVLGE